MANHFRDILCVLVMVFLAVEGSAQDRWHFAASAGLDKTFGYTKYILDTPETDSLGNVIPGTQIKSELKFPLDAFLLGGKIGLLRDVRQTNDITLELGVFRNISSPSDSMIDQDWLTGYSDSGYYFNGEWSYTKSRVELSQTMITLEGRKRIFGAGGSAGYAVIGVAYQRIIENMFGYYGWQIDLNRNTFPMETVGDTVRSLYYRVTFVTPLAGLQYGMKVSDRTSLYLKGGFMAVYASDFDDHLLRKKNSNSKIWGAGAFSNIVYRYFPQKEKEGSRTFIDIAADFRYLRASGTETQHFYGDDPGTPNINETGLTFQSPHEIRSLQAGLELKVGLLF